MADERSVVLRLRVEMDQYKRQLRQAEMDTQRLERQLDRSTSSLGRLARAGAGLGAGWAIAGLIKDSVSLEAAYSRTMRQVAVASKAPASALQELDDLAMKLGADTVYSAQDAAATMLELAKGGLSPAQIEAGALKNSLTLAAAGGLELGDAANSVVNTMGAFGIKADDSAAGVAALAGAANASTADVSDMTQALSQVGTEANSTGLSVQETTAMLAAFSNQGFKGSDAGTALKTMLTLLTPQTKKAREEMARLGLDFTKSNGEFVSGAEIAGRPQKAYKDMSAEERSASLSTVFGADGRRAANALIEEGSKGIQDLTKETSDLGAAQKLADAGMAGTSGSLEQLSGNVETAKIQIGKGLAPSVKELADRSSELVGNGDFEAWAASAGAGIESFLDEVGPFAASLADLAQESFPALKSAGQATVDVLELAADVVTPLVEAFNTLPDSAQKALILAAGAQQLGKRLGPIPGLSDAAGTSLVGFGSSARRGGDDAEKGGRKFAGLAGSLKDFAGITAALKAGEMGADIFDSFSRSAGAGKGKTTAVNDIAKQIKDSNVGKYANDLGIDIGKLATEMARYGQTGEYYAEVTDKMASSSKGFSGLGKSVGSWLNPFITDLEKTGLATHDLGDIASDAALKVNEQKNAFDLVVGGLGRYSEQLQSLPSKAVTEILTPGAIKGKTDVLALQKAYALTPDEVTTIMQALGFSTEKMAAVQKAMTNLDGTTATVTTIQETVKRTITESYDVPKGSKSDRKPSLALPPPPKEKKAAGGPVIGPGTATSDSIPALLSNGEHVLTAAEVDRMGGQDAVYRFRQQLNSGQIMAYATGGAVVDPAAQARYDRYQELERSSRLDLLTSSSGSRTSRSR
jgi:TP901 family phage tail tape measure protein